MSKCVVLLNTLQNIHVILLEIHHFKSKKSIRWYLDFSTDEIVCNHEIVRLIGLHVHVNINGIIFKILSKSLVLRMFEMNPQRVQYKMNKTKTKQKKKILFVL